MNSLKDFVKLFLSLKLTNCSHTKIKTNENHKTRHESSVRYYFRKNFLRNVFLLFNIFLYYNNTNAAINNISTNNIMDNHNDVNSLSYIRHDKSMNSRSCEIEPINGEVTIPNTYLAIDKYSFSECFSLTNIVFQTVSQLTLIEAGAFNLATSLTGITIPASVAMIG